MLLRQLSQALILLSCVVCVLTTSCKKEDTALPVPSLISSGLNGNEDTINIGQPITLHPKLASLINVSYQWMVNGVSQGTDSIFTFTPSDRGDYIINFKATNSSGSAASEYRIHVWGKYENGFFIVNEGWFGHENGTVNFYNYGSDTIQTRIFTAENTGKDLGTTTEFGTVYNGKLYLVSKQGAFVATDAYSLKETNRIDQLPANGRYFLGIDNNTALLSTAKGIYLFNLQTFTTGTALSTVTGEVGNMVKAGGNIYISQSSGVTILDGTNYTILKKISGVIQGFTIGKDGAVWSANSKGLVRFNTQTLDTTQINLPYTGYGSWIAWNALSPVASTKESALFMAKVSSFGAGGNLIYKYVEGDPLSVQTPFITLPSGQTFYGAALRYDASCNQIIVTTTLSGYQVNHLLFYDASTGVLLKDITFNGYYFPAVIVFNNQ